MNGFIDIFFYSHSWLQSITRTHNQSSSELFFLDCRGLAPFSFSFYDRLLFYGDWLVSDLRVTHSDLLTTSHLRLHWILTLYESIPLYEWTTYIASRRINRKHIRYCWEVFNARCVGTSTARTTENTAPVLFAACLLERVYRAVCLAIDLCVTIITLSLLSNQPFSPKVVRQ
jgi:hypothetical protein